MPDLYGYLAQREHRGIDNVARAVEAWKRIEDRSSSIVVWRGNPPAAQTAQTVRIEFDVERGRFEKDAGTAAVKRGVIFGVRDHPTETDTDLQKDDRVTLADGDYRVVDVIYVPGEVQAGMQRIT